jgi:RHS repeat-associated protein
LTPSFTPTAGTPAPKAVTVSFLYDGDGVRVAQTIDGVTTYFVGNYYEKTGSTITKYYYSGGQRVAMRKSGTVYYLFGDHLGSTSIMTDANGNVVSELRYKPWGETRYAAGNTPTQYQYTGQYSNMSDFGLMFYNARWYDSALGRFAQADSIVQMMVVKQQVVLCHSFKRIKTTTTASVRLVMSPIALLRYSIR